MHFSCKCLPAEIDPLKLGILRDKFADICGSHEAQTGAVLVPCCQATSFPTQQPEELQRRIPGKIAALSIPLGIYYCLVCSHKGEPEP